ncbi:MAG: hypothetical protein ACOC42_03985 [Halobacteriota archaeon]
MELQLKSILGDALYRLFKRNGLLLVGALFVVNLVMQVGLSSLFIDTWREMWTDLATSAPEFAEAIEDPDTLFPLAMDMPEPLALGLAVIAVVLFVIVLAVAVRVFHSTDERTIKTEFVFDNIAWVTVNLFVGMIVFGILWTVGLLLFVIPGLFVFVTLIYCIAVVAVEDRSFVAGFSRSWGLTKGHRLRIFLLFLTVWVLSIAAGVIFGLFTSFIYLASPTAGSIVDLFVNSLVTMYFAAVLALSYRALTEPDEPNADADEPDEEEAFRFGDQPAHW